MATAAENKAVINSLIAASNETTGNNNADLTTAVRALIDGFGGGSGALGIKRGAITLSESYAVLNVQHNCGKLPLVVYFHIQNPLEVTPSLNHITGGVWQRDSFCTLLSSNSSSVYSGSMRPYTVGAEEGMSNHLTVNAETMSCNPPFKWLPGDYTWTAIYEA